MRSRYFIYFFLFQIYETCVLNRPVICAVWEMEKLDTNQNLAKGQLWLLLRRRGGGERKKVWETRRDVYECVGRQRAHCVSERERGERERERVCLRGGVLVICHRIRYPDKAIREKQILQPRGFNSLVLHPDELLKNGVQLKLVLYERLQICLLSGLLPPVFIGLQRSVN